MAAFGSHRCEFSTPALIRLYFSNMLHTRFTCKQNIPFHTPKISARCQVYVSHGRMVKAQKSSSKVEKQLGDGEISKAQSIASGPALLQKCE